MKRLASDRDDVADRVGLRSSHRCRASKSLILLHVSIIAFLTLSTDNSILSNIPNRRRS